MGVCTSITKDENSQVDHKKKIKKNSTKSSDNVGKKSKKNIKMDDDEKKLAITSGMLVTKSQGNPSEHYKILKKLGEGSYGVVSKVKHLSTGQERAMKKILKNTKTKKEDDNDIINEIEILKLVDVSDSYDIVIVDDCSNSSENILPIPRQQNINENSYVENTKIANNELSSNYKGKSFCSDELTPASAYFF